jgi:hypothetical protein
MTTYWKKAKNGHTQKKSVMEEEEKAMMTATDDYDDTYRLN